MSPSARAFARLRDPHSPHRHLGRRHVSPLLVVCGYALLGAAWIVAIPPGNYPDADAHYIRAVAASQGQFVGTPYTGPALDGSRFKLGQARVFRVPPALAEPTIFACVGPLTNPSVCSYLPYDHGPVTSQISVEGTDGPLGYLFPGALMRLATNPVTAEELGRVAALVSSLALLATAVALLWSRRTALSPYIGLTLAVTPTVLFLAGEVGPNGLEPTASICFLAGLLRLSRRDPDEPPRRWMFVATGAAAFVLALARPLGVAWVLVDIVAWAVVFGRRAMFRLLAGTAARVGVALGVIGCGLSLAWELSNRLQPTGNLGSTVSLIPDVIDRVPAYVSDLVGRVGVADLPLPQPLVGPWILCVVVVAGIALAVGSRRERLGVAGLFVGVVVVLVAYAAAFNSLLGGGLAYAQPRHVLPFALLVPLFIGEIVSRRVGRLGAFMPHRVFVWCALVAAVVGVGAFYYASRRYAVGVLGPLTFFLPGRAQWSPSTGWMPLMAMAVAGGLLMVVGAVADVRWRRDVPADTADIV